MVAVDVLLGRRRDVRAARRRAVDRRCQQPGAKSLSGEPGPRAGAADRRGAEHGRHRRAKGLKIDVARLGRQLACRSSRCRRIGASASTELKTALAEAVASQPGADAVAKPVPEHFQAEVATPGELAGRGWRWCRRAVPGVAALPGRAAAPGHQRLLSKALFHLRAAESANSGSRPSFSLPASGWPRPDARCRPSKRSALRLGRRRAGRRRDASGHGAW